MKFQWNTVNHLDEDLQKMCIELEYKLRPRITRFLIAYLERECCGDFSAFHFDVDLNLGKITISDQTPRHLSHRISQAFDQEINRNFVKGFFADYINL